MTHELKCWEPYLTEVADGQYAILSTRRNDRHFRVGDHLRLMSYSSVTDTFTGAEVTCEITYIFVGGMFGVDDDHVVMGIKNI